MHTCDNCRIPEERVFQDTWTRAKLCLNCLSAVADHVTNSPRSEGEDNLLDALDIYVNQD